MNKQVIKEMKSHIKGTEAAIWVCGFVGLIFFIAWLCGVTLI